MAEIDPYSIRRCRKIRRTRFFGFALLGLVGVVIAFIVVSTLFTTPWGHRTPELEYLASLPYPDPHPDQENLLVFTPRAGVSDVSSNWLRLNAEPDGADAAPPGGVYIRFTTTVELPSRGWPPPDHAYLHLAAAGESRLPAARAHEHTLVFQARRTIELSTGRDLMEAAGRFEQPPLRDLMLFKIHPDAILDLLAHPAPTMAIAGYEWTLSEAHLESLSAFAATLRLGYTPP